VLDCLAAVRAPWSDDFSLVKSGFSFLGTGSRVTGRRVIDGNLMVDLASFFRGRPVVGRLNRSRLDHIPFAEFKSYSKIFPGSPCSSFSPKQWLGSFEFDLPQDPTPALTARPFHPCGPSSPGVAFFPLFSETSFFFFLILPT